MRKKIRQHDHADCGAACLKSIAAYYRYELPIAYLRQMAGTDKDGTTVLGMIEAATKLGFDARGVRCEPEQLTQIPLPAIAHLCMPDGRQHFVVTYQIRRRSVTFMDPADGQMHRKSPEDFNVIWKGVLILLLPRDDFGGQKNFPSHLSKIGKLLKPHLAIVFQVLFGAIVFTLLGLCFSIYVQKVIDHVLAANDLQLLNMLSTIMIALLVLQHSTGYLKSVFALKTGQHIDAVLILGYYRHLLSLPQQFFNTMRVGEIMSRINDAVKIRAFINEICINFLMNVFILIFSFILMFSYYWKLATLMLLILPCFAILYIVADRLNKKYLRRIMEQSAVLEANLVESLHAVSTVKMLGLEQKTYEKTESAFIRLLRQVFISGKTGLAMNSTIDFVSRVFTVLLFWVGSIFVIRREISTGELLSFYALIGYVTGPAAALIGMNRNARDAQIAAERLFEIMDLEQEQAGQLIHIQTFTNEIRIQNLVFCYGYEVPLLHNLQMSFRKGTVSAIVGESGCGKSTIAALLQKIYDRYDGRIYIDDQDLRYLSNDSVRQLITVVPQKVDLFKGSIVENVAPGDEEPDLQKIVQITDRLGMSSFIQQLPGGFFSQLNENGSNLSGGQRQRIAIARAFYREPQVLILDEATASLDSISEGFVSKMIEAFVRTGKTVIIIAHRLSTIRYASKIFVMKNGTVAEVGTHEQLLATRAEYFHLWSQQAANQL